jgi:hypothetical protein
LSQNLLALFNKGTMPVEMQVNSLKLFKTLLDKSEPFFSEAELPGYLEALKKIRSTFELTANGFLNGHIDQLIAKLENLI